MRIARLFQPRNPQFWLLIALNLLSLAISHILRTRELPLLLGLLLAGFAGANFVIGIRIAVNLMRSMPDEIAVRRGDTG